MDASQILVVILATTLAVFLVLAITLAIILIRVAKQIQRISSAAERTVASFESIVGSVQKAVAPAVLSRFIMEQIQRFTDKQHKRDKKE